MFLDVGELWRRGLGALNLHNEILQQAPVCRSILLLPVLCSQSHNVPRIGTGAFPGDECEREDDFSEWLGSGKCLPRSARIPYRWPKEFRQLVARPIVPASD